MRKAKRNRVATVLWGHHRSKAGGSMANWIRQKILFRLADTVVCYSHAVAEQIRSNSAFKDKTFVAPNAVDQGPIQLAKEHWESQPEKLREFQQKQGIQQGPNLLFVSRIKPRNKLEMMVEVLEQVGREIRKRKSSCYRCVQRRAKTDCRPCGTKRARPTRDFSGSDLQSAGTCSLVPEFQRILLSSPQSDLACFMRLVTACRLLQVNIRAIKIQNWKGSNMESTGFDFRMTTSPVPPIVFSRFLTTLRFSRRCQMKPRKQSARNSTLV